MNIKKNLIWSLIPAKSNSKRVPKKGKRKASVSRTTSSSEEKSKCRVRRCSARTKRDEQCKKCVSTENDLKCYMHADAEDYDDVVGEEIQNDEDDWYDDEYGEDEEDEEFMNRMKKLGL